MAGIIAVERESFPAQRLGGGVTRWTSPELYEKHGAQISFVQHPPDKRIDPHSHTVDEVIYLLDGSLEIDGRKGQLPAGSILFIGAHGVYGFTTGPQGVLWIFVRPTRPQVDISKTDLRPAEKTANPSNRAQVLSAAEIGKVPWRKASGALEEQAVITKAGYPRVAFQRVGAGSGPRVTASRHQFLYVSQGTLRVDGHSCRAGGMVSIPAGASYAPAGQGGPAGYLLVEPAEGV